MAGHTGDARPFAVVRSADRDSSSAAMPSFQAVYIQYFDFIWASARRLGVDAAAMDDVVQEIFIVIHSRLHTVQQPEALRSWIYGVVRRTVSNHHRSRRARAGAGTTGIEDDLQSHAPTPFEVTQKNSDLELLAKLLAELDETKREVFALVELDEMTVPEVAEALDIPLNTAYSRLRAARFAFEAALARHEARSEGRR